MSLYESLIRPALFLLGPETAHDLGLRLIRCGAVATRAYASPRLGQTLFGVRFPNPVGLAAGFDKDAVALDQWRDLGFGFVEAGTVTAQAQPGNPRPRLFRLAEDRALINRMGFNNDGAAAAAERIGNADPGIPVGINLGKSRATPLERAAEDYQASFRLLSRLGDYFVINVSSPNTPGLRQLQDKAALKEVLQALREVDASRPMFVKVSPDLTLGQLDDVAELADGERLTGIVAVNTTTSRDGLARACREEGGLSGVPLRGVAEEAIRHLAAVAPKLVLIGVGGIFDADDLYRRIAAGAHLCQMYTGWVYGGPGTVPRILEKFDRRLESEGIRDLEELRGSDRSG